MSLKICSPTVEGIKRVLKTLSEERFESNMSGAILEAGFDYDFVDSDNLYSDDRKLPVIKPE